MSDGNLQDQPISPFWDVPTSVGVLCGMAFMGGAFAIALIAVLNRPTLTAQTASTIAVGDYINGGILLMTVIALCVQSWMQIRSNRIAYKAAVFQELVLRDTKRDRTDTLLADVIETIHVIKAQILIYRARQEAAQQVSGGEPHELLKSALTDVLLSDARLSHYRTRLIVSSQGISTQLVPALHGWIDLVHAITKRDAAGTPTVYVMTHDALQERLQVQLRKVMDAIGEILASEQYRQQT